MLIEGRDLILKGGELIDVDSICGWCGFHGSHFVRAVKGSFVD